MIQVLVAGILMGGVFALVSSGLALEFGVTKIVNFAHGEFLMVGMYAAYWVVTLRGFLDIYSAIAVAAVVCFGLGFIFYRLLLHPVLDAGDEAQILITIGVSLAMQGLALGVFSPEVLAVPRASIKSVELGVVQVSLPRIVALAASLIFVGCLAWFLKSSAIGRRIRACADNAELAAGLGMSTARINGFSFGIGSACAGIAGCLILPFYHVSPYVGLTFTLSSFVVVVIAGMGSLWGVLVAGLLVGVVESVGEFFLLPALKQVGSFVLLACALIWRPQGLFGKKGEWWTI